MNSNERNPDTMPHSSPESLKLDSIYRAPRVAIEEILGAGREAIILHQGEAYRLRITSRGRLLLTK